MTHDSDRETNSRDSRTKPNGTGNEDAAWSRHCLLFANMDRQEIQEVRQRLSREVYSQGEVILREGKTFQELWIIAAGECEVFKMIKPNTEQRLTVLDSGSVFGEMSFFQPAPHSASVRALTDVEVFRLSREEFANLEASGSLAVNKILMNTVKVLSERLRQMDEWTCQLVESPVDTETHGKEWREFRSKLYTDWHF